MRVCRVVIEPRATEDYHRDFSRVHRKGDILMELSSISIHDCSRHSKHSCVRMGHCCRTILLVWAHGVPHSDSAVGLQALIQALHIQMGGAAQPELNESLCTPRQ